MPPMKVIGEPDAGKPHVRFDEGIQEPCLRQRACVLLYRSPQRTMATPTTPLFVKTHDFNVWLLKHTQRFPKNFRSSYTSRLEGLALEFEEVILMANQAAQAQRLELLGIADGKLLCLRAFLRYTLDFQLLGSRQFEFAAQCIDELGRLLGAWLKGLGR